MADASIQISSPCPNGMLGTAFTANGSFVPDDGTLGSEYDVTCTYQNGAMMAPVSGTVTTTAGCLWQADFPSSLGTPVGNSGVVAPRLVFRSTATLADQTQVSGLTNNSTTGVG